MTFENRADLEAEIKRRQKKGDLEGATTVALEGYGPEIGGYLASLMRDPDRAAEVFSMFCEDVWRGLEGFRWESSFRTWAYTLARHAASRFGKKAAHRPERNLPLSTSRVADKLAQEVRDSTARYLKTEMKDRMRALRESLADSERELLVLRVDRRLDWLDIARIVLDEDGQTEPTAAELRRRSASLRKRFERLKEKLRKLAEKEGLLEG
jgi:RNA polymerase sigma-70 factor (ECF subfamily)